MSEIRSSASASLWSDTILWTKLEVCKNADSADVATVLRVWMPLIETILAHAGTSPTDFTLHDAGHAFRVAQRMVEIMPPSTLNGLTPYELSFLLLSAYLHDIGMTPEQRKVSLHYDYLLTANADGLHGENVEDFQRWLDDDQEGITPPMCPGAPSREDLRRAAYLTAHYCRDRHNDWSAEWIRANAPKRNDQSYTSLGTFGDWVDDLIRLCRSHHYGRGELLGRDFDPRLVGQPGQVLHLRYLACVLRMADILEFDPERTPDVILSHRDVDPRSVIYWHKDRGISSALKNNRLIVSARPENARLYRAVERMIDDIDQELALCRALADETHFEVCPRLPETLPHEWQLTAAVHRDLQPKPGTFVYINSAFRPNTEKILQILSGIELYGDRLAAIRELLQNAFDAVRESIAYQRLTLLNPANRRHEEEIGKLHRVELRLEQRNDGYWLVCSDNGVGMNRTIIENHLLVSGQPRRHDLFQLDRRCRDAGFATGRTGQFGIGVLSYFMISDRLRLATRRALQPKDGEAHGWTFESEGVGTWGELRPDAKLDVGTRVELHLKTDVFDDAVDWYRELFAYLTETLVYVPCEFHINCMLPGCPPLAVGPGWTRSKAELENLRLPMRRFRSLHRVRSDSTDSALLPAWRRLQIEEDARLSKELAERRRSCLRWECREGDLPNASGRFRLQLEHFELPGGASLQYFDAIENGGQTQLRAIRKGFAYSPQSAFIAAWKGMRISIGQPDDDAAFRSAHLVHVPNMLCEVDFHSDIVGSLEVSRGRLLLAENGSGLASWLAKEASRFLQEFVLREQASRYATSNAVIARLSTMDIVEPHWGVLSKPDTEFAASWGRVKFPAVDSRSWIYQSIPEALTWKAKSVSILPCIRGPGHDSHYEGLGWWTGNLRVDRVLGFTEWGRIRAVPIWQKNPWSVVPSGQPASPSCRFPPAWKNIVGIAFDDIDSAPQVLWNPGNRIVRLALTQGPISRVDFEHDLTDAIELRERTLTDAAKAAAWVLGILALLDSESLEWDGLTEREPEFVSALWALLFPGVKSETTMHAVALWREKTPWSVLHLMTPTGRRTFGVRKSEDMDEIGRWMPSPGPDWTLEAVTARPDPPPTAADSVEDSHSLRKTPKHAKQKTAKRRGDQQ